LFLWIIIVLGGLGRKLGRFSGSWTTKGSFISYVMFFFSFCVTVFKIRNERILKQPLAYVILHSIKYFYLLS
jgi:hypothetical protein